MEANDKPRGPDSLEMAEARKFLTLPQKAKDRLAEKDPVEWQRLVDLGHKVWSQWQSWFAGRDKDAEHPFVNGVYFKR